MTETAQCQITTINIPDLILLEIMNWVHLDNVNMLVSHKIVVSMFMCFMELSCS